MGTNRVYTVQFRSVNVSAIQDIFNMKASASNGIVVRHIYLSAGGQSAVSEMDISLKRFPATVTQGSGGTTPTINPSDDGQTKAAQSVVHANDTTQTTTSGTAAILEDWNWNILLPFEYIPAAVEERDACLVSEGFALTLNAAPSAGTVQLSGFFKFEEVP